MGLVSLAALTILDAGPLGQIDAAHIGGFKNVGLRLQPLLATDQVVVGDPAAEEAIKEALARTGLGVLEIGVFPLRPDTLVEAFGPTLAFSHRIGARYIVCPIEDSDRNRRLETFRRICELAESCALDALVEFNPYSACRSLAEAAELVRMARKPNAGVLVDALHLSRSGGHPRDIAKYAPGMVPLVHLCDAPPPPSQELNEDDLRRESRTARLLPGEGSLWLDELLDALGPDAHISVEAPSAKYASLPAAERARLACHATQALLSGRNQQRRVYK